MLNRKLLRKQARQAKKQRKAEHYQRHRLAVSASTKRSAAPPQPTSSKPVKTLSRLPRREKDDGSLGDHPHQHRGLPSRGAKRSRPKVPVIESSDLLLDFAERAIEEGILGSDGEFDEEKMDQLLGRDYDGDGDDSEGEQQLAELEDDASSPSEAESSASLKEHSRGREKRAKITTTAITTTPEPSSGLRRPPSSFSTTPADEAAANPAQRKVQGLFNRLSSNNFQSIASSIVALLQQHSRHDVAAAVCSCILTLVEKQANLLESLLVTISALISALTHLVGIDLMAKFLEQAVSLFDSCLAAAIPDGGVPANNDDAGAEAPHARVLLNCVTLISFLYDLQAISSKTIISILNECTERLSEVDVEMVLRVLRICGSQLRLDDANELRETFVRVVKRAESVPQADRSSRFTFLLECIQDLRNNRRKLQAIQDGELATAKRQLRELLLNNGKSKLEPLSITLADIRSSATKGRWWLVGAAWDPSAGEPDGAAGQNKAAAAAQPEDGMHALARKCKMNTDVRRAIFCALMSSEDYLDAYHRLILLRLPSRQEREIAHVLLHCCRREKLFNPFYALVASKFLETRHNFVITFRYIFWDRLKEYQEREGAPSRLNRILQDAHFFGLLMAEQRFPLAVLRRISFGQLSQTTVVFLRAMLSFIFESAPDDNRVTVIFCDLKDACSKAKPLGPRQPDNLDNQAGDSEDDGSSDADERPKPPSPEDSTLAALEGHEMVVLAASLRLFLRNALLADRDSREALSPHALRRLQFAIGALEQLDD